jgi:hypothetical protein
MQRSATYTYFRRVAPTDSRLFVPSGHPMQTTVDFEVSAARWTVLFENGSGAVVSGDACKRAMLLEPAGVCRRVKQSPQQRVGPRCPCPLDPSRSGLLVRLP